MFDIYPQSPILVRNQHSSKNLFKFWHFQNVNNFYLKLHIVKTLKYMAHKEKNYKLENGDRIKVEVTFHFDSLRYEFDQSKKNMSYYAFVTYIEKGKKKGVRAENKYWLPQIQETALELWQNFKPKFTHA